MYIDNKNGGIYRICGPDNKVYIGSTKQFRSRTKGHLYSLLRGDHISKTMQADWDKFGESVFRFEIVEVINDPEQRLVREQELLAQLFASYPIDKIYNTSNIVGFYKGPVSRKKQIFTEYRKRMISRGLKRRDTAAKTKIQ